MNSSAYLDDDVVYLLGLLFGRGKIRKPSRRMTITWDIRRMQPKLPEHMSLEMDLDVEDLRAANNLRSRITELLEADIEIISPRRGKLNC